MKKPDTKEFTTIAKVSAIGLGLIGLIGFIVALIMGYIPLWFFWKNSNIYKPKILSIFIGF